MGALGYDQIARLFGVSVADVFDLERKYERQSKSADEKTTDENDAAS